MPAGVALAPAVAKCGRNLCPGLMRTEVAVVAGSDGERCQDVLEAEAATAAETLRSVFAICRRAEEGQAAVHPSVIGACGVGVIMHLSSPGCVSLAGSVTC